MCQEESYKEKDIAFYSATVNAWYATKFEKDKHLLSLASVGIGFLVTLATVVGVVNLYIAAMYILAVISFLVCILVVLAIFSRNAIHLQKMLKDIEDTDPVLSILDKTASFLFLSGIIFTLLVGLFSGVENFKQMEIKMTSESGYKVNSDEGKVDKSVDGASGLRPRKPDSESSDSEQSDQKTPPTED